MIPAAPADPLETAEPRPPTFTERRAIAVAGGLAIVAAVGVLVRVLGAGPTPVSAAKELAGAAHARPAPAASSGF
ncbi:MAG TPA: hypothetical protein VHO06_13080 [Polyangia bacterium]|nr:hypothetical protein [Polyangia bacterium]